MVLVMIFYVAIGIIWSVIIKVSYELFSEAPQDHLQREHPQQTLEATQGRAKAAQIASPTITAHSAGSFCCGDRGSDGPRKHSGPGSVDEPLSAVADAGGRQLYVIAIEQLDQPVHALPGR